ncbi:MAG: GWxTD domain-containing protein, partial [Bacteroidales bacterium]|nr:GWxTD domain-containing protein [Bacteroidales bacterium]
TIIIYFKIDCNKILYAKENNSNLFYANINIEYNLYKNYNLKQAVESKKILIKDSIYDKNKKDITDSLFLNTSDEGQYLIEIKVFDINKQSLCESWLDFKRTANNSEYDFLICNSDNTPLFRKYITDNEKIIIKTNNKLNSKLYIKHYPDILPIALPPFSVNGEKPIIVKSDSLFILNLKEGCSDLLSLKNKGVYFCQIDTANKSGTTILRYNNKFPAISEIEQMLYPLRYITEKNEYEQLYLAKDKKKAIDNFWIEQAGNNDRARELIRKYYNRVEEANNYFTTFVEGWKSDRGIIYIVFGAPKIVYKYINKGTYYEQWIYGTENSNIRNIVFDFFKDETPFSNNDYTLLRSENYKSTWYMAVQSWRR